MQRIWVIWVTEHFVSGLDSKQVVYFIFQLTLIMISMDQEFLILSKMYNIGMTWINGNLFILDTLNPDH